MVVHTSDLKQLCVCVGGCTPLFKKTYSLETVILNKK